MKAILLALVVVGCNGCNSPIPVPPVGPEPPGPAPVADAGPVKPTPPPPPHPVPDAAPPDVCMVQCAHLRDIKCPDWSNDCEANCRRLDVNLIKLHSKPVDHTCLTAAATCTAARHCGK